MKYQVSSIKYQVSNGQLLFFVLCTLYFVLFVSCHKEAAIPSYIHIDQCALTTTFSIQGYNTQKITDAWVDVDGQSVGAYEMPCTFPVLYSGQHTITILPGIKDNGISETRTEYPFYTAYTQTVTLVQGSTLKINPFVTYATSANFSFIQNFDGAGTKGFWLNDTSKTISDTCMWIYQLPDTVVKYGNGCGGVILKTNNYFYTGETFSRYSLPITPPIYLEMDYNCNTQFSVGLKAYDGTSAASNYLGQEIVLTMRPTTGWNKIYINLSPTVIEMGSAGYSIYFTMQSNSNFSYFYLDNVKLIY